VKRRGVDTPCSVPQLAHYSPAGNWKSGKLEFCVGREISSFPESQSSGSPTLQSLLVGDEVSTVVPFVAHMGYGRVRVLGLHSMAELVDGVARLYGRESGSWVSVRS